jgi:large subunit ribosomal protein L22
MEAKAINRYVPTSPRKMRLLVDLVRGKGVEEALSILHYSPKHSSKVLEKTIHSAVSNLQNKIETGRVDSHGLYIKTAFVDGGPSMKRILPAPMGRAFRVIKRSHHLTVVVAEREIKKNKAPKQPVVKQQKQTTTKTEKE